MRRLVRETIVKIRDAGGTSIRISEGGRHTRVHFTGTGGEECTVLIHRGNIVTTRFAGMIRSQLRRLNEQ
jgi:hypothetical protein